MYIRCGYPSYEYGDLFLTTTVFSYFVCIKTNPYRINIYIFG